MDTRGSNSTMYNEGNKDTLPYIITNNYHYSFYNSNSINYLNNFLKCTTPNENAFLIENRYLSKNRDNSVTRHVPHCLSVSNINLFFSQSKAK